MQQKHEAKASTRVERLNLHRKPLGIMWMFQIFFLVTVIVTADVDSKLLLIPASHLLFGTVVIYSGFHHQIFRKKPFINHAPLLWLPLFTVAHTMGTTLLNWDATSALIENHSQGVWFALQSMRVFAFMSVKKQHEGVFPFSFAWFTALPDGWFGLSALLLLLTGIRLPANILAVWNIIGFAIIVPFGWISHQSGMPPTMLYKPKVPHEVVFYFPMAIAPLLVVPMLLSWNQLVAIWALSQ